MARGRKPELKSSTGWASTFYDSVGTYVQIINKEFSKKINSEPVSCYIRILGGYAFKSAEYKKEGIPVIRISDFADEKIALKDCVYYKESIDYQRFELKAGDIIIALTGGTIAKLAIVQDGLGKLYLNQRVGKFEVLHPERFLGEYVYWIARSVQSTIKNLAWGAAIPNVSPKQIENIKFPIPDKQLQKGVVEFLNDLKNNTINANKVYFEYVTERLIHVLHKKQLLGKQLLHEHLLQLDRVTTLRQQILQDAVQGRLVPQDPSDEPASVLLKKVKAEKEQLIREKKIKPEKPLPAIKADEVPFEIPDSWVWCRLRDVSLNSEAGKSYKCSEIPIIDNEWGVIKVSAVSWDNFLEDQNKLYSQQTPSDISAKINQGDFIISRANTSELVGKSVVVRNISKNLLLSDKTIRFKFSTLTSVDYINLCNRSKAARQYFGMKVTGSSPSMKNITRVDMMELFIPLPPKSEQYKIVAKVDHLMALCDELEQSIKQNQDYTRQLLQVALKEALEPAEKRN